MGGRGARPGRAVPGQPGHQPAASRSGLDPLPPGLPVRRRRFAGAVGALERAEHLTDRVDYAHVAGLDSFFTALTPSRPGPRWRLTVLTVVAVFAITLAFQLLVAPHVSGWPLPVRLLLSAVVVVVLLGYVVTPALSRLFRRWLHPARD